MKTARWKITLILMALALASLGPGCATRFCSANARDGGKFFGCLPDGTPVRIYTLRNENGIQARILNYGGIIQSLIVPDRKGHLDDVVLGYNDLDGYLTNSPRFGALIGRYANRIANGRFTLDGVNYQLAVNSPPNSIHGGVKGFNAVVWHATPGHSVSGPTLQLTYTSHDGEEGFPGQLKVTALYTLTADNALRLDYTATSDQDIIINLTQHSYFNLAGHGDILGNLVYIKADKFTPVDSTMIPTGELMPVTNTPLDFRVPITVGARINENNAQLKYVGGYDFNWIINKPPGELGLCARVTDPASGRVMEVWSTEPGLQFYTANSLDGSITGKYGQKYSSHCALAVEPQHYPDSPNHPNFPSTELKPGEIFRSIIIYKFSVCNQGFQIHTATKIR